MNRDGAKGLTCLACQMCPGILSRTLSFELECTAWSEEVPVPPHLVPVVVTPRDPDGLEAVGACEHSGRRRAGCWVQH